MRAELRCCALALLGCATPRQMHYTIEPGIAMGGARMEYAVFEPSDRQPGEVLPLVVFLHGGGDGPDAFDRHGITTLLDDAMTHGRVPRAVIVLPEGDLGFWVDWNDGTRRYLTWIVSEVMPEVASRYHTIACPSGCHVMGVSMGGIGALHVALHYPRLFASIASISGPILNVDQMIAFVRDPLLGLVIPMHRIFGDLEPRSRLDREDPFQRWSGRSSPHPSRILLAWATRDREPIRRQSRAFHEHLESVGIAHEAIEFEGDHAWVSWAPIIEQALRYAIGGVRHAGHAAEAESARNP